MVMEQSGRRPRLVFAIDDFFNKWDKFPFLIIFGLFFFSFGVFRMMFRRWFEEG